MTEGKGLPWKNTLWRGAALLGGAALLSKLIGTLQKVPLQNLAGDEAFGIYSAVYALAMMWITLASAGVPVAVSVLVAEQTALGNEREARRIVAYSLGLIGISGLAVCVLMVAGAERFALWMGIESAAPAIRMSAMALLFAPFTAVLRGARQGQMQMLQPALSQLIEQTARVAFMVVALLWAVQAAWSPASTAAAVHGGLAIGAAAGLLVMLWRSRDWWSAVPEMKTGSLEQETGADRQAEEPESEYAVGITASKQGAGGLEQAGGRTLLRRIAKVAIPVAFASAIVPLIALIDAFTLPRLLREGSTLSEAMVQFGVYNRGTALLQLVIVAAAGAAAALVPALTAARVGEGSAALASRLGSAQRLAWWLGSAAAAGLALLAAPINVTLFADDRGTAAIAIMALAALGGTLQAVSAAQLQALGEHRAPALNLAAAALLKLLLNLALAPAFGIAGASAAMAAAYAAAAALNARALRRRVALPAPQLAQAGRSVAALASMAAAVALAAPLLGAATGAWPARLSAAGVALPCALLGAAVFALALPAWRAVQPQQWRALPGLAAGNRLDRLLLRLYTKK